MTNYCTLQSVQGPLKKSLSSSSVILAYSPNQSLVLISYTDSDIPGHVCGNAPVPVSSAEANAYLANPAWHKMAH